MPFLRAIGQSVRIMIVMNSLSILNQDGARNRQRRGVWRRVGSGVAVAMLVGFLSGIARAEKPPGRTAAAIRGVVHVPAISLNGIPMAEISGVAWDADDQMLYAVSDRGVLFRVRLRVGSGVLTGVEPVDARRLVWPGKPDDSHQTIDAEGLGLLHGANAVATDAELLVSTEGQPRVLRVSPDARVLGEMTLPVSLADSNQYRADNAMLEAIATSSQHGLMLAAESPMRGAPEGLHRIQSATRHWMFARLDHLRSRLKAIEAMPDGSLVILERAAGGKRQSWINALRRIKPDTCGAEVLCEVEELLHLDEVGLAQNFEAMAHLGDRRLLLVSDNLGGKRSDTVFMLVELGPSQRE